MQEKEMVLDALSSAKASIGSYSKVITECADQNLRRSFQQMRDGDEKFQYDLYRIAEQKGYYITSPDATAQETSTIKNSLTDSSMQTIGTMA
ncbi:MAG: spore coat protein [Clostridiales bacterium]|jgi:spore coat protein CotF|nr:spore coat protein [Clostridiales bacterium]